MKHLGDITAIKGNEIPTVNVIIGGSPCQDLSVAGKREGLNGERSGLFMEQIRIIKEMREKDAESGRTGVDIRPRFMVWENVPGAFSVNDGKDFAAVLEETIRVVEKEAPNIQVPRDGWTLSGCFVGRQWSVAWRVLDAQFWGVPQRRRRIALVADFGGQCAQEILFERESVSRDSEKGRKERKGTSGDFENSPRKSIISEPILLESNQNHATITDSGVSPTLSASMGMGGGYVPMITDIENNTNYSDFCIEMTSTKNTVSTDGISPTLTARMGTGGNQVNAIISKNEDAVCFGISAYESNAMKSSNPHSGVYVADTSRTLDLNGGNPACNQGGICVVDTDDSRSCESILFDKQRIGQYGESNIASTQSYIQYKELTDLVCSTESKKSNYIVRRLTPLECLRLQGFPDKWLDIGDWVDDNGKVHKETDSQKYKAIGNSIAIPPWFYVLSRLNQYCDEKTMGSLFDGIGGFPLIWSFLNDRDSCVWCSEIEPFCNAVTRKHFPE